MDSIVEASGHNIRPFECSTCLKRFTRQENLKRHARSVHQNANAKPIKCIYCTVTLSREDLRTRHIRKCHPSAPLLELALPDIPTDVLSDLNINRAIPERTFNFPTHEPTLWRSEYITSYFKNFHPRMPVLHEPSFDIISEPETLLLAVSCLGSMYHPEGSSTASKEIFDSSYNSLQHYVQEDDSRYRENWVLQSFILLETFAIYSCDDILFLLAQKIHRDLVDAARRYNLLQDSISIDDSEDEEVQNRNEIGNEQGSDSQREDFIEKEWRDFIRHESQKRIIYSLYYLDTQLSITTNTKPLLSALEIKYSLPSRDDLFSTPTPQTWSQLNHEDYFSFNDQDDENGNPQPRPAHGLLYESMMHLIHPGPKGRSLKLLWYSPFAALVLVVQIQMMARELTCASVFLYSNVRENDNRHNLTMIAEEHRGPISQALNNLADLLPRRKTTGTRCFSDYSYHEMGHNNSTLWHFVWISWYYTCIALTHQDALLSTGIVECNLPAAISTTWELGKPRAKIHRDVYEDRDVFRIVNNLEQIIYMLNSFPISANDSHMASKCLEDPFVTVLGFKACMMGWRVVRLMMLNIDKETKKPSLSFGITPTRAVLFNLMDAVNSRQGVVEPGLDLQDLDARMRNNCEIMYLKWAQGVFTGRNTWPIAGWMTAVLQESLDEATKDYDKLSQMQA